MNGIYINYDVLLGLLTGFVLIGAIILFSIVGVYLAFKYRDEEPAKEEKLSSFYKRSSPDKIKPKRKNVWNI